MYKKMRLTVLISVIALLLSGCMYPSNQLSQNQIPYNDQIQMVQTSVDRFQSDNSGILPIKTREATTPLYEKYLIDFKRITPKYMAEPPGNAFESGGVFQYVLVDVETNPTVKIFDLRIAEALRELNLRLNIYKQSNGYLPFEGQIADNVYTLDYSELGYKEVPFVVSPYSNKNLPFVVTGDGKVYIDYRIDLYEALQTKNYSYQKGEDIRPLLVEESMFVPAYSLPYTVDLQTKEPIFLTTNKNS